MCIKNCVICGKEIPEHKIRQGKDTCCHSCSATKMNRLRASDITYKEKLSESLRKYWSNEEHRQKQSKRLKQAYENPEAKQKASERNKLTLSRPEVKEKHRQSLKRRWSSSIERQKMSKKVKEAYQNPEVHEKISKSVKSAFSNPEVRKKMSDAIKKAYENPELRKKLSDTMKQVYQNPEVHEKISKSVKSAWPNIIETKRKHGTLSSSKPEKKAKELLEQMFNNVLYHYKCDRYPFNCDFYIKDLDLFIELNFHWTHGFMPYDSNNAKCKEQLIKWKEKAQTSKYWQSAINVWTFYDMQKLNTFKSNNLNYKIFYNYEEFITWYNTMKGDTK